MFANVVQPKVISLFSSTGSAPLQLFSKHVDPSPSLRSDSLVHLLDDTTSLPPPPEPGVLIQVDHSPNKEGDDSYEDGKLQLIRRTIGQTVLHIQSPTLRTTYVRCPPHRLPGSTSEEVRELGITLPWMHLQVRRLGEREWAFEVGISDRAGRKGIIRFSTFQKEASVVVCKDAPILHVPLRFPTASSGPLTSWSIISIDLGYMIQQFNTIGAAQRKEAQAAETSNGDHEEDAHGHRTRRMDPGLNALVPSGGFGRVTFVKVFANCRLRRIWFSEERRGLLPWEFELYAS